MAKLDDRRRLDEDHAALEALTQEVHRCVCKADWRECDMIWRRLCERVEDHFRFEERTAELESLAAEREAIVAALDRIGIEIELKYVDQCAIEALLGRLHDHLRHERQLFYDADRPA